MPLQLTIITLCGIPSLTTGLRCDEVFACHMKICRKADWFGLKATQFYPAALITSVAILKFSYCSETDEMGIDLGFAARLTLLGEGLDLLILFICF